MVAIFMGCLCPTVPTWEPLEAQSDFGCRPSAHICIFLCMYMYIYRDHPSTTNLGCRVLALGT